MDYTHLDEKIRFLVECGVDEFEKLYKVIGRDELEKYRTSPYHESSRPLLHRLETICRYSKQRKSYVNIDFHYQHKNKLSKEALDHIEWEREYEDDYRGDVADTVKREIERGEIQYDEELGSFRPGDEYFENIGMGYMRANHGSLYRISEAYSPEVAEFVYKILERKKIIFYDESRKRWEVGGHNIDCEWLKNMIVLKVIEGHDSLHKLWDVLGDEINKRYPFIWRYHTQKVPGMMLLDECLGVLFRAGKIRLNETTRALEFAKNVHSL